MSSKVAESGPGSLVFVPPQDILSQCDGLDPSPHFSREMRANGKTAPENTSIRAWPGYVAATLRVGSTTRFGSAGSRFDGAVLR